VLFPVNNREVGGVRSCELSELPIERIKQIKSGRITAAWWPFKALPAPYIGHALDTAHPKPRKLSCNSPC
jgi:hypothetical protein